jgi:hypothetical protein
VDLHPSSSGLLELPGSSQSARGRMQQLSLDSSVMQGHLLVALLLWQALLLLLLLTGANSSRVC